MYVAGTHRLVKAEREGGIYLRTVAEHGGNGIGKVECTPSSEFRVRV